MFLRGKKLGFCFCGFMIYCSVIKKFGLITKLLVKLKFESMEVGGFV